MSAGGLSGSRAAEAGTGWRIAAIVLFTFVCYLCIGLPLALLPELVHVRLGYSTVWAGAVISLQYLATLFSRALVGRMADTRGARLTVCYGLLAVALSGVCTLLALWAQPLPSLSLACLLLGRLALGWGEGCVGTGAIAWGIGLLGSQQAARVISWNGIATYGAIAIGAPLGVLLAGQWGMACIGLLSLLLGLAAAWLAWWRQGVPVLAGEQLALRSVLGRVLPYGAGLALASTGFGVITAFITLYYASHHWPQAALGLSLFGLAFVAVRMLFPHAIRRFGGLPVARLSLTVECVGLLLLWQAGSPALALAGIAATGAGFALVFPALGVEAMARVPAASRGAAIGVYSVFLDLSLGISGPLAGLIAGGYGYAAIFLCAALAVTAGLLLLRWLARR